MTVRNRFDLLIPRRTPTNPAAVPGNVILPQTNRRTTEVNREPENEEPCMESDTEDEIRLVPAATGAVPESAAAAAVPESELAAVPESTSAAVPESELTAVPESAATVPGLRLASKPRSSSPHEDNIYFRTLKIINLCSINKYLSIPNGYILSVDKFIICN